MCAAGPEQSNPIEEKQEKAIDHDTTRTDPRPEGRRRQPVRPRIEGDMKRTNQSNQAGSGVAARVALLIDTDNASVADRHEIEQSARKYGEIVHCIALGRMRDEGWQAGGSLPILSWGEGESETGGRNSADIALTISAMDLLYTRESEIDVFCIASGDSDFATLAGRLRRAGKKVVGISMRAQAAGDFVNACNAFELLERKMGAVMPDRESTRAMMPARETERTVTPREYFLELVTYVIAVHGLGWWPVGWLADQLSKVGRIRYKDLGKATLTEVLESYPREIETMVTPDGVKMRLRTQLSVRQIMAIRRKPPVRPGRDRKGTDKSC